MKKKDLMLGAGIIVIALAMLLVMQLTRGEEGNQIQVTLDGKIYGTYSLSKDQTIEVKDGDFYNRIRIEDGKAYMEEANCPDGYCEEQGKISGHTQTIVCLPHKLVVEVLENESDQNSGTSDSEDAAPDTIANRKLANMAMLVALAMIFSYVESLIPINFGIPGMKLGVANLVTVTGLYFLDLPEVFLVVVMRILLTGFLFGNGMSIIYSLAGGILSFLVMALMKKLKGFSVAGVSIAGGVSHNIGQIIVASIVVENLKLVYYLPALLIAGTVTGFVMGMISKKLLPIVKRESERVAQIG